MNRVAVAALVLAWMTKLLCLRAKSTEESLRDRHDHVCETPVNRFGFVKTPLTIPFLIFVAVVLFQLVPLPLSAIKTLSPPNT